MLSGQLGSGGGRLADTSSPIYRDAAMEARLCPMTPDPPTMDLLRHRSVGSHNLLSPFVAP